DGFLRVAADVANGRNATRQPNLQFIFHWLRDAAAFILDVRMDVDQSRHDVLARGVDFGFRRRPSAFAAPLRHRIEWHDGGNPAVLNDDVLRTGRRGSVAFDYCGVAD